ncbi:MAG: hypothetical protein FRX49_07885 [Trebouxia sp. A1-2]|nr:MAG: hypothetical protein FRX49_07885 [Trebouxia sp. A1-2]
MVLKRKANKRKGTSGSKKQQQHKKSTVASCLTWLPFLSVPTLLVVMMYGLLDSATLGAALSALKRAVQATLPDLALTQISPMVLMIAAVCAAFAESSSVTSGMGHQVRTTAASLMQAAMVLLKVTCYTLIPMLSADIMASVRKTLLLRTAQVHLQVLVLENRLLELLPAFLMVATSSALLIESCFVLFSKKMSPHTDGASMLANAVKATCFQPGHKQALVVGAKLVLYNGAGLAFAACVHAVATSPLFWGVCKEVDSQAGHLPTEVQACLFTLAFAGLCSLFEKSTSGTSSMGHQVRTAAGNLVEAAIVFFKMTSYTLIPMASAGLVNSGCYVLYFKHMSRHTNAANTVDDATMATFSQPKHQQVHVAASKGERQEHADKLQHQHEKGTGSAEDSAVVQPYVDSSKPLETIKAARSPSPKRQPVGDNGKSLNWHDGYLAAVRALLGKAVGEPCMAQLQIARSLAQLLKAVPAWMLVFTDASNQGCTAHAGLQSFQVPQREAMSPTLTCPVFLKAFKDE